MANFPQSFRKLFKLNKEYNEASTSIMESFTSVTVNTSFHDEISKVLQDNSGRRRKQEAPKKKDDFLVKLGLVYTKPKKRNHSKRSCVVCYPHKPSQSTIPEERYCKLHCPKCLNKNKGSSDQDLYGEASSEHSKKISKKALKKKAKKDLKQISKKLAKLARDEYLRRALVENTRMIKHKRAMWDLERCLKKLKF